MRDQRVRNGKAKKGVACSRCRDMKLKCAVGSEQSGRRRRAPPVTDDDYDSTPDETDNDDAITKAPTTVTNQPVRKPKRTPPTPMPTQCIGMTLNTPIGEFEKILAGDIEEDGSPPRDQEQLKNVGEVLMQVLRDTHVIFDDVGSISSEQHAQNKRLWKLSEEVAQNKRMLTALVAHFGVSVPSPLLPPTHTGTSMGGPIEKLVREQDSGRKLAYRYRCRNCVLRTACTPPAWHHSNAVTPQWHGQRVRLHNTRTVGGEGCSGRCTRCHSGHRRTCRYVGVGAECFGFQLVCVPDISRECRQTEGRRYTDRDRGGTDLCNGN